MNLINMAIKNENASEHYKSTWFVQFSLDLQKRW